MHIDIPLARTRDHLFSILAKTDIAVPLRTEYRTTQHTERWTICRLLATLANEDRLKYPVVLQHRDRPDFVLGVSGNEIGIEATEAVPEQYAAFSALAEREFPDVLLDPGHFKWGSPRKSVEEMRDLLRHDQIDSAPWVGDRPIRDWASYMESVIKTKQEKLAKSTFAKFSQNWLAIYDNLPVRHVHLENAIELLLPALETMWCRSPAFDTVFIEHGPVIASLSPLKRTHMVLHDLW